MKRPMMNPMDTVPDAANMPPSRPSSQAPLGSGGRFQALENKLSRQKGVTDPGALAAAIGRRKLGKERFQKLAAAGRKRSK